MGASNSSLLAPLALWLVIGGALGEGASVANQTDSILVARENQRTNKRIFEQECLEAHNKWRRRHGAADLQFDRKIAAFSQKRADFIAQSDGVEFRHPADLDLGENLAWHSRETKTCAELVQMWYDEVKLYDFGHAKFSHDTGHFTQLVWRDTKRLGCASAISAGPQGGIYLVCNYDPPGNFLGEEGANVLPAKSQRDKNTNKDKKKPQTRKKDKKIKKKKKNKKNKKNKKATTTTTTTTTTTLAPAVTTAAPTTTKTTTTSTASYPIVSK